MFLTPSEIKWLKVHAVASGSSVPFVHTSIFELVPCCFNYYCFSVYLEIQGYNVSHFAFFVHDFFGCFGSWSVLLKIVGLFFIVLCRMLLIF